MTWQEHEYFSQHAYVMSCEVAGDQLPIGYDKLIPHWLLLIYIS